MEKILFHNTAPYVMWGPFKGLRYYNKIVWSTIVPKWLGTYEMELHDIIADIIGRKYTTIVDIGAAEGYYAVGLAKACPAARVIAYDIDWLARYRQKQLATLNQITNLEIRKACTHAEMERIIDDKSLLISDVEGFEADLLDPVKAPALLKADLLVECHPYQHLSMEKVADLLQERFRRTHRIQRIPMQAREAKRLKAQIPALIDMEDSILEYAAREWRKYFQVWLWIKKLDA
jgi:hypothetical protein